VLTVPGPVRGLAFDARGPRLSSTRPQRRSSPPTPTAPPSSRTSRKACRSRSSTGRGAPWKSRSSVRADRSSALHATAPPGSGTRPPRIAGGVRRRWAMAAASSPACSQAAVSSQSVAGSSPRACGTRPTSGCSPSFRASPRSSAAISRRRSRRSPQFPVGSCPTPRLIAVLGLSPVPSQRDVLVGLGWKPTIARAAVDEAWSHVGSDVALELLIREALHRCPVTG
jgi:hypothetical protein